MEIIVALISACGSVIVGVLAYLGVKQTNKKANDSFENRLVTAQAVTNIKIDELTKAVQEHNNFARRMPVVEEKIENINHRINNLEKKVV